MHVLDISDVLARQALGILGRGPNRDGVVDGCGVPADLPTSAPIGNALADRAFEHAFAMETLDVIRSYYQALRVARSRPRLETVLDVTRRMHGLPVLTDLLHA